MEKDNFLEKSEYERKSEETLDILRTWVNKTYDTPITENIKREYLEAIDSLNEDGLRKLSARLENHIDYHEQKVRDVPEDMAYIEQLKNGLKFLGDLLN